MGIRHGIAADDSLVLLLDPKRGGVSNPEAAVPADRNLVGIDAECGARWRIEETGIHRFYHLWERDGVILTTDGERWYEVVPSTGAVTDSYPKYRGRFE